MHTACAHQPTTPANHTTHSPLASSVLLRSAVLCCTLPVSLRFLASPLPSILNDLSSLIKSSEDDLTTLQGQEKYLVKDLETTEQSIEEIVGKEQKAQ